MNVLVSVIFHITVKYVFQGQYCTFSTCKPNLRFCRVNLYSFSFANFCKSSGKFCSFVDSKILASILFDNHNQMHEQFRWTLLFSFFLQLRFYLTGFDEIVETLHRYCFWLVYQRKVGPNTRFCFRI